MADTPQLLFEYLRDLLYDPRNAALDPAELDEDYRKVGEGLLYFARCLDEQRELTNALAKGNLSVKLPPPDNQLASPLKALHASLKHLTWTSQQVAKGDYQQRLDFMGEFADAFNTMTEQLEHRQRALETEIENSRRKTLALEQSYGLLEGVTNELQQWILVLDRHSQRILFQNKTARAAMAEDSGLWRGLRENLINADMQEYGAVVQFEFEMHMERDDSTHYFSAVYYPMHWKGRMGLAYVITDISDEKRRVKRLENAAYQDTLTGINNRYYGMQVLREWLEDGRTFSVCFVDLDNLKFVNDNFGHTEGDRYIISAAELLQGCAPDGMVCRLGGDEFMLLVPGLTREQLEEEMERARAEMISTGKEEGRPYMCSLSYGVVEIEAGDDVSSGELLSLADERMYEYKRKHKMGRGKTLFYADYYD